MIYIFHAILIILLLALVICACVLFTNSVECYGKKFGLADSAVGGILAAIGTALPETIVPLVAILGTLFSKSPSSVGGEIALGAVLGSPFLLSTVAFFVTGISVLVCSFLKKRECELCSNPIVLIRDLKFFVVSYTVAVLCAFIPYQLIKYIVAILLICYYCWYVKRTLKNDCKCECENDATNELIFLTWFYKNLRYELVFIILQIIFSLALLILSAHFFVKEIIYFSKVFNLHPVVMSLLLAPIATELPECFNSVIWTGQSKDTLSISNITGALVFQSCIPVAIGVAFTPWKFDEASFMSVILVYISLLWVYLNAIKSKGRLNPYILVFCGIFYLIYILYILKNLI